MELIMQFVAAFTAAAITLALLCRAAVKRMERYFQGED